MPLRPWLVACTPPEHVVGLLTAGGEWEELIVVLLAIGSGHAGLAIGNVVGSCLANLIGSMPLGFFGQRPVVPDRSARAYALVMVLATLLAAGFLVDAHVSPVRGWRSGPGIRPLRCLDLAGDPAGLAATVRA